MTNLPFWFLFGPAIALLIVCVISTRMDRQEINRINEND